jgi:multimeric flavodoxin WrbA
MMRLACVSASNVAHAGEGSTSLRVCRLIADLVERESPGCAVDVVRLVEHELSPCCGCGACYSSGRCVHDETFNGLFDRLSCADGLFVVAAHYAPIPAKLVMLLEKLEQLAFLPRFSDESCRSPLSGKPAGIVGHGGGTAAVAWCYREMVLDTVANALGWPIEMNVVAGGSDSPRGVVFPVSEVRHAVGSPFPIQEYDWGEIERLLAPLVAGVVSRVERRLLTSDGGSSDEGA